MIRVHVISDDRRVREAARALPEEKFKVSMSHDRGRALHVLDHGSDVLVADLQLEGYALVRDLRDRPYGLDVAVVMVGDRPQDVWLCKQAGADEVLTKPLSDTTTLLKAVEAAISQRKKVPTTEQPSPATPA